MAIPTTRTELKEWCLRDCGAPVIEINIADEQVEDAIDDAIDFFQEYHFDGLERAYYVHQVTAADISNGYFTMDPGVTGVSRLLPFNSSSSIDSLFSVEYRLRFNDLRDVSSINMADYYIAKTYLALLDDMLTPNIRHRFNRHTHRLEVDDNWSKFVEGSYIVVEVYRIIDPEVYNHMYSNWVLRSLAAAETKRRWGQNLIKFAEIQLPGGVTLNGERILQDAKDDIERIKTEFILKFQEPDDFFTE